MHFQPPYKLKSFNLLDYTWRIYRANFVLFFQLATAALLPYIIIQIAILSFRVEVSDILSVIIRLVLSAWALGPMLGMIIVTENMMQENYPLTFTQSIKMGSSYWLRSVKTYSLLWIAAIIVLFSVRLVFPLPPVIAYIILLIVLIGTVFVMNYLRFILQVIALRGDQPGNPIKRSWNLVTGQWWVAFGRNLLISLIIGALSMLVIFPLLQLYEKASELVTISLFLYAILIYPVAVIFQTLLFLMLEARKASLVLNLSTDIPAIEPSQSSKPQSESNQPE